MERAIEAGLQFSAPRVDPVKLSNSLGYRPLKMTGW